MLTRSRSRKTLGVIQQQEEREPLSPADSPAPGRHGTSHAEKTQAADANEDAIPRANSGGAKNETLDCHGQSVGEMACITKDMNTISLDSDESSDDDESLSSEVEDHDISEEEDDALAIKKSALSSVDEKKLIHFFQDCDIKSIRVEVCKSYLRKHRLRLKGKKAELISRIKQHLELIEAGAVPGKYAPSTFIINCKGDVCNGDVVLFDQAVYEKMHVKLGRRTIAGRVVSESYGAQRQQHTFTIEVFWSTGCRPKGPMEPLRIKGRNLYKKVTLRQRWNDEAERKQILDEKHERGAIARFTRATNRGRGRHTGRPLSSNGARVAERQQGIILRQSYTTDTVADHGFIRQIDRSSLVLTGAAATTGLPLSSNGATVAERQQEILLRQSSSSYEGRCDSLVNKQHRQWFKNVTEPLPPNSKGLPKEDRSSQVEKIVTSEPIVGTNRKFQAEPPSMSGLQNSSVHSRPASLFRDGPTSPHRIKAVPPSSHHSSQSSPSRANPPHQNRSSSSNSHQSRTSSPYGRSSSFRPSSPYRPFSPYRTSSPYRPSSPYRASSPYGQSSPQRPSSPYRTSSPYGRSSSYRPSPHRPSTPVRTSSPYGGSSSYKPHSPYGPSSPVRTSPYGLSSSYRPSSSNRPHSPHQSRSFPSQSSPTRLSSPCRPSSYKPNSSLETRSVPFNSQSSKPPSPFRPSSPCGSVSVYRQKSPIIGERPFSSNLNSSRLTSPERTSSLSRPSSPGSRSLSSFSHHGRPSSSSYRGNQSSSLGIPAATASLQRPPSPLVNRSSTAPSTGGVLLASSVPLGTAPSSYTSKAVAELHAAPPTAVGVWGAPQHRPPQQYQSSVVSTQVSDAILWCSGPNCHGKVSKYCSNRLCYYCCKRKGGPCKHRTHRAQPC